jgi:hypothetical protein
MLTKDDDIIFICRHVQQQQWLRHGHTTLNDTIMPFATAFFDGDNTTIVLTKDYINCERNYFIIFDDDCLVHADPRQRCCQRWNGYMKWRRRAIPFPDLPTMKGTFVEFNCDMFSYSDRCIWTFYGHGILLTVLYNLIYTSVIYKTGFISSVSFSRLYWQFCDPNVNLFRQITVFKAAIQFWRFRPHFGYTLL